MSELKKIEGSVTAAKGFAAAGVHCGVRKSKDKKDLALIVSQRRAAAASVYTQNKVKGAPITVTRAHLEDGMAQAIVCNSGNANTCNADGVPKAQQMCAAVGGALGLSPRDVIVASTGVIGQPLPIEPVLTGIDLAARALSDSREAAGDAAVAIMTTDTHPKEAAFAFTAGGRECRIGGIAKGSGMIHPNMATMLSFITTDCAISPALLHRALLAAVRDTFNMVSVDGDTSTNDMVSILANGMAENPLIETEGEDYDAFCTALGEVCLTLCRQVAGDGEGATKLLECVVTRAPSEECARVVAKSVITSSLFKAAMFGADANWGRILCAIGYADAQFDIQKVAVTLESAKGSIQVCKDGAGVEFSEEQAKEILLEPEIFILIDLGQGSGCATAWGCDLTYDYVKINGDYRT